MVSHRSSTKGLSDKDSIENVQNLYQNYMSNFDEDIGMLIATAREIKKPDKISLECEINIDRLSDFQLAGIIDAIVSDRPKIATLLLKMIGQKQGSPE